MNVTPAAALRASITAMQGHLTFACHHQHAAFDGGLGVHESNANASLVAAMGELANMLDVVADLESDAAVVV